VTLLKIGVPALACFDTLRLHFNWLCDGGITHLVSENLVREIDNMELYLRDENHANVVKEMDEWSSDCDTYYAGQTGQLYKLVGVLRGADIFWNPAGKPVLFHKHGDLLEGDSPRIVVRTIPSQG
jgi:hypothetical protein